MLWKTLCFYKASLGISKMIQYLQNVLKLESILLATTWIIILVTKTMVWEKDSDIPFRIAKNFANPGKAVCFLRIIQCIKLVGSKQAMPVEGLSPDLAIYLAGNIVKVRHCFWNIFWPLYIFSQVNVFLPSIYAIHRAQNTQKTARRNLWALPKWSG